MKVGVFITGQGEAWSYQGLRECFVEAERLGFDEAWTMDNSVGSSESARQLPVPDAWTVLPALAEATSRIRLGTLVTPVNRRPFAVLAKSTSVFDQISDGRLDLGLGAGDHPDYWEPWGMPYLSGEVRVAQLREQLEVLKRMWTQERASFEGEYITLTNAINEPKPVQKPHPPIWIGLGRGKRLMPRLAAEYADGINIYMPEAEVREMVNIFERCCAEIGRDPDEIGKSRNATVAVTDREIDLEAVIKAEAEQGVGDFRALLANILNYENVVLGSADQCVERLRELGQGFDQLIVKTPALDSEGSLYNTTPAGHLEAMRRFAAEVMPHLVSRT